MVYDKYSFKQRQNHVITKNNILLENNDNEIIDSKAVADYFSDYFCSIIGKD